MNDPGTEPEPEVASPVVVVESQEQPPSPCGYQDADDHADDHESKPGSWCIPSETLSRVSSSSAVHDFGQKLDQSIAVQMEILKELKEVKVELQRKRQRSPEDACESTSQTSFGTWPALSWRILTMTESRSEGA